jgi:hypothetical protein
MLNVLYNEGLRSIVTVINNHSYDNMTGSDFFFINKYNKTIFSSKISNGSGFFYTIV